MLAEYDFQAGVRGKYARRYRTGSNVVVLSPEVAKVFPTSASVNEVLLGILSDARIDTEALISSVQFPDETWEWLDLLGYALRCTQTVGLPHDASYIADDTYRQLMVRLVNRDLEAMTAIYLLLRCRFIHQAAAQTRLFCEGLITWRFIAQQPTIRAEQFENYSIIERHRIVEAVLEAEQDRANPKYVQQLRALFDQSRAKYDAVILNYTFTDRKGRTSQFSNWCNVTVADQASRCDDQTKRLYQIVYKQMSAYVHGSSWSLRRQLAYSLKHYDPKVVHIDIATVTRTFLVIWVEWCSTCKQELGWELDECVKKVVSTVDELDARQFPVPDSMDI